MWTSVDEVSVSSRVNGYERNALTESTVETWRTAGTDTVATETLDCLLLDSLVASETGEIGRREIEHDFAAVEAHRVRGVVRVLAGCWEDDSRAWTGGTDDDRGENCRGAGREQGLRRPLCNKLIDFLYEHGVRRGRIGGLINGFTFSENLTNDFPEGPPLVLDWE